MQSTRARRRAIRTQSFRVAPRRGPEGGTGRDVDSGAAAQVNGRVEDGAVANIHAVANLDLGAEVAENADPVRCLFTTINEGIGLSISQVVRGLAFDP